MIVWLRRPPSDQDLKKYLDQLNVCRHGALTEFAEPTTTVTENGVLRAVPFTTRSPGT